MPHLHETFEIANRVALGGSFSGTYSGDFMRMPMTGKAQLSVR